MLLILLFGPLICSIVIWSLPSFVSKKISLLIIPHLYLIYLFIWAYYFFFLCKSSHTFFYLNLGAWMHCGTFYANWGFQFDTIGLLMIGLVLTVSTSVHFFSFTYMSSDSHIIKFFSLVSLFTFFMLMLVVADNFLVLFVGWEGIGLCSFLLISFWHARLSAIKSGLKAILLNRIGDCALIGAMSIIFYLFRSLDFSIVFSLFPLVSNKIIYFCGFSSNYNEIIGYFLLIGAVGKSAQLGLHGWLPEAMEGPTPVSALIHAATLVTAGVFLVIRCSPIFEFTHYSLNIILILGGLTCLFGASVACAQNDIKKIIAYSTTSQLGYMFFVCGLSGYNVALFHLINHGFFKALLFLCAGTIILHIGHQQDLRKFGGLITVLPLIYSYFLIGILALIGFPFLSGFYSKDLIIETSFCFFSINSYFVYWISVICAFLTAFYSVRCMYLTFLERNKSNKKTLQKIEPLSLGITFSLTLLVIGSIFSGIFLKDFLSGFGTSFFEQSIYIKSSSKNGDFEYLHFFIKNIPFLCTLFGLFLGVTLNKIIKSTFYKSMYNKNNNITPYTFNIKNRWYAFFALRNFLHNKWFLDFILNNYIAVFFLKISYDTIYKLVDKGFLEILIINFISHGVLNISRQFSIRQTGAIYGSSCLLLLGLIFFFYFTLLFT